MGISSMTGFGRGTARGAGVEVLVEISSVNRRQFDARVNLPRSLSVLEVRVVEALRERIERGQLSVSVKVEPEGGRGTALTIHPGHAAEYVRSLRRVAAHLGLQDDLTARCLTELPRLEEGAGSYEAETLWPVLAAALGRAIEQVCRMRAREGAALERDLTRRMRGLEALVARISRRAPHVSRRYREQLRKRLEQAGVAVSAQDPQLLREVLMFCERCDITEEIVRLKSHMDQFRGGLIAKKAVGRTLDFLCQEMFREINTIGSKANDAALSRVVVDFKSALETVREQVQNIQ